MVYIIKSDSYRLLDTKIKELTKEIDKENITHFDLTIDNLNTIIEECNYTSLFNDKKAIIVNNVNIFSTKYEYKEDMELLEKYLNNPNNNTILIFITDNISVKKKCVKIIKDNKNLFELKKPIGEDLKKLVIDYLKINNFKIENSALTKLINNLNENYDFILNELDKVIVTKKDYLITNEDIDKYTIKLEEENIFDFVDLVIKKDTKNIFIKLEKYIQEKQEPAIILANIASQYRLIYSVKNLIKDGFTEKDIALELGIHPYRVKLAHEKSYNYTNEELKEKLLSIGSLDEKIKLGIIDKYVALKLFLVNL